MDDLDLDPLSKLFIGIQSRHLPEDAAHAMSIAANQVGALGTPNRLMISEDPDGGPDRDRPHEECAICGMAIDLVDRQPATLHVTMEGGIRVGLGVWTHRSCLARCPQSGEQRGIPW